ncbi:MAG TPA: hypothetical protein VEB67_02855, partial [Nitrososphaerales archaeon]|nr:hypothetical protein [Nitrososphaerales archaeon]
MSTSSLTLTANSFVVLGADMLPNHEATGPAGVTVDRNGGASLNAGFIGHEIPGAGSSTFSMTANAAPTVWVEQAVQFGAA